MVKPKIIIVGCGIIGALVAYELSRQFSAASADIVVLDRQQPAQDSTGAALGVLMGIISSRVKGRTWRLREASIRRYQSLIVELAEQGHSVPFNRQGIVKLCFDEMKLPRWETLREKRRAQGWPLEIWGLEDLKARCPQIALGNGSTENGAKENSSERESETTRPVKAAIYSPADGQVHPVALTHALIKAAKARGVMFHWDTEVTQLVMNQQHCGGIQTPQGKIDSDWVVLTAGLGSAALSEVTEEPLALMPVLGQAMEIELPQVVGHADFQPVINGDDIQFVPLGGGRYWLGATVEFPPEDWDVKADLKTGSKTDLPVAEAAGLANLRRGAEGFVEAIAQAKVLKTWSGLRPRPVGQPAPVIKPLGNTDNITLATGHYRNGVLLAPATAQQVCQVLKENLLF